MSCLHCSISCVTNIFSLLHCSIDLGLHESKRYVGQQHDMLTKLLLMQEVARQLQLSERMLALAAAVSIDFDYFSRHSSGGGGMLPFFLPIPMPSPP